MDERIRRSKILFQKINNCLHKETVFNFVDDEEDETLYRIEEQCICCKAIVSVNRREK